MRGMALRQNKGETSSGKILIVVLSRFLTKFLHFVYVVLTEHGLLYSQRKKQRLVSRKRAKK